ncbi:alpha/beta-hydrolase [Laetiporus sulphureus 93-53]|uniref:Alpha/beta-hydrolase n=1 Tax=Laetiporus sulphureus 93-53 TaxID=1314785 RepID=A0A165EAV1_9APHY|nr:alpha/beta-hydrolase [Laetiporus sulphureus 93-53]KZT06618.1 alpha/beta-hydrolase [Laetiporus sulphureus 93-53]
MSNILPSIESFAKGTVATAAGIGTLGVGLLFFGQNYLIYPSAFPPGSRTEVPLPIDFGLPYQDPELITPDGVRLRCYLLLQRKDMSHVDAPPVDTTEEETDEEFASRRPTVMMFHGNGGNVGHRIPLAKVFYVKMRCNVFMLSYRGYGRSEGSPSEKGIKMDAQTALEFILSHPVLSRSPIVLYGQSIGGAVAIDLASRNPRAIRALILENTFLSLPRLVPTAFPILGPLSFLCHQKWDSVSKVPLIPREMPILMLSGVCDEVVPREHMQALWEIVQRRAGGGSRKGEESEKDGRKVYNVVGGSGMSRFVEFERGTHNDTCVQKGYWTTVAEFLASLDDWPSPASSSSSSSSSSSL